MIRLIYLHLFILLLLSISTLVASAQTQDPFFQQQRQMIDKYSQEQEIEKMGKEIESEKQMQVDMCKMN